MRSILSLAFIYCSVFHAYCQEAPWYERALVGIETGPTGAQFGSDIVDTGYVARFDGRECIEKAVAAHCDYMVIWARDGVYAYYDSKLQPKAPGLGKRDVLRETVESAKAHEMPVIAYCVLQYPTHTLHEHPDWRMRDKDGKPIERVCFNSPYIDYVKQLLAEMMSYEIDGFHLDMVDQGFGPPYGCWCEHCQAKFENNYGHAMPKALSWDAEWEKMMEFRYDSSAAFETALDQYVKETWPGTSVDFNYHGNPPFSFEVGQRPVQHGVTGDFITGETGQWAFSALGVGFNAEFYRATASERRVQVVMQRGVRHYHDQTTRPLNDMRWETLTLLAHGAFGTMVDKTAYDGWLDPVFYQRLAKVFQEANEKRKHFGQPLHADVGIYFSHRTRDWLGRENAAQAWQGTLGAHKALAYAHVPWGIVLDENAGFDRLRSFPVIVLPNIGILLEGEVTALTAYVEAGGNLIITGATGLHDRYGNCLETSVLEHLIGGRWKRTLDSEDNHVRFKKTESDSPFANGISAGWPFLVQGKAVVYEPVTAKDYGELLPPHRTVMQRKGKEATHFPMSADTANSSGPAILVNQVGRGKVVTLACSPGEAATSEFHITEARQLLPNAVRYLLPEPMISVTAPSFVESVVTREGDTIRVHFIARIEPSAATPITGRPAVLPTMMEDTPLFRVHIHSRDQPSRVTAIDSKTSMRVNGYEVTALIENVHEVLLLEIK
jgi:hypothetical protein